MTYTYPFTQILLRPHWPGFIRYRLGGMGRGGMVLLYYGWVQGKVGPAKSHTNKQTRLFLP